jgi:hypothetical protein
MNGWIAVDFDGTLAVYDDWKGPTDVGAPILPMIERVKVWLKEGKDVRVFTARVYAPADDAERQMDAAGALLAIQRWCAEHLGQILPVTCTKDFGMIELWDDRCVQLEKNTGAPIFEMHTKAVAEFLNELYAIMVDPVAEGPINVADIKKALIEAAKRDREKAHERM